MSALASNAHLRRPDSIYCDEKGCNKYARRSGTLKGKCVKHGGGMRCCSFEGCEKVARSIKTGRCSSHHISTFKEPEKNTTTLFHASLKSPDQMEDGHLEPRSRFGQANLWYLWLTTTAEAANMHILRHRTKEEQQQHNNRYYLYCLTLSDSEIGHDKDFRRPPYGTKNGPNLSSTCYVTTSKIPLASFVVDTIDIT